MSAPARGIPLRPDRDLMFAEEWRSWGRALAALVIANRDCVDPEPVLKAINALGVKATQTVFIGDSRHDMESGRAAGVKTAAVLWGPFDRAHLADLAPDYWLEKPQDLRELYEP